VTEAYSIAIVGSGPAGLSAAMHAARRGMSHVLLEKSSHLSDTIYRYQRGKHVMATPAQLVLRTDATFAPGTREAILQTWENETAAANINVMFAAEVKSIAGEKGAFHIALGDGRIVESAAVVLAIGTQGNPNLLGCDGHALDHVQYTLDDPAAFIDEHIVVVGAGDAGIENALGLVADTAQGNVVTLLNRSADFARAKDANRTALLQAQEDGRLNILPRTEPKKIEPGWLTVETADGEVRMKCDRIVARVGSSPPRKFVESLGVRFANDAHGAFPKLSPTFESSIPGLFVIGALAGYPLIKHCMNQGYDVIEYIAGNAALKPADEPILEKILKGLPGNRTVDQWITFIRDRVEILRSLSTLQMREFLLWCKVSHYIAGATIFEREDTESSLFGVVTGSVLVELGSRNPAVTIEVREGSIFGEIGVLSGRPRGATARTQTDCILIEVEGDEAQKLMAQYKDARDIVNRIMTERLLLQIFGSGLTARDLVEIMHTAETHEVKPGEEIISEGDDGRDLYVVRSGSMVVEKAIAGKPIFLNYIPAGSYFGEMAILDGSRRAATVRAAIKSEVIRIPAEALTHLLARKPQLVAKLTHDSKARQEINAYIERQKHQFNGVADMYSAVAKFLVDQGIGEATDVLLINEELCIGCDNCEKACADLHDGLSRLDREAGRTYAHMHVPTSCRHCEHPHCMTDCPPDAIHRGSTGEIFIDQTCIGCGNCQRNCPYDVIRMDSKPPEKPGFLWWLLFGAGPGPGEPDRAWRDAHTKPGTEPAKTAIKCDMCAGIEGGPACVRGCPTGAAIRVSPEEFLSATRLQRT
jgi:CRP-like cAMP-binding protein/thioredoxin reductase/Fe-S-cluster-containing hydrogenase component 2